MADRPKDRPADDALDSFPDLPVSEVTVESVRGGVTAIKPEFNPKEPVPERLKTEWIVS